MIARFDLAGVIRELWSDDYDLRVAGVCVVEGDCYAVLLAAYGYERRHTISGITLRRAANSSMLAEFVRGLERMTGWVRFAKLKHEAPTGWDADGRPTDAFAELDET